MLAVIGAETMEDLFSVIPPEQRASPYRLRSEGGSETEVLGHLGQLAAGNDTSLISFLGGGFYDHFIPAAVDSLSSRAEFVTCYTPYQAECSQGTLQALYEYQSAICRLTGLEVANASNYDGGSALAEAVLMARRITRRSCTLIDGSINPLHLAVVKTYLSGTDGEIVVVPPDGCRSSLEQLIANLDDTTASVVLPQPNFFGSISDFSEVLCQARRVGALAVSASYPMSLGLLRSPGEQGFDIAVGEGQSLGNPLSFGGPCLGFLATRRSYARQLPGRVAGATVDGEGRRGFVLTLQAREQHIRRQRATSNICSNQGLCALRALIYLSCLGREGFSGLARLNYDKAHYALDLLTDIPGVSPANRSPVFNEFTLRLPRPAGQVSSRLLAAGFAAGLPLDGFFPERSGELLVAVTEKRTSSEIERYAEALRRELVG